MWLYEYHKCVNLPLRDFWSVRRPVFTLATGLVVVTTLAVGFVAHWLIPALPLAMAFALGAVISPTDAVAVGVITQKLKVPPRLTAVLNGESLMNDATGLVGFKFERLNPLGKIKEMFSPGHSTFELLLALAKVGVVGTVTVLAAREEATRLLSLAGADFVTGSGILLAAIVHIVLHALVATAIIAAADYAHSWFKLEKDMKMSLQELKDDMRSDDGDPHVKAKMRARARQNSKKRMMADVKSAAVIVTNPTHVSVALRYSGSDPAPIVVAKGHVEVALAIRREARAHGVPILENRRLARALDAAIAIGKPVKVEHFAAVAKLLSLVYALKRRTRNPQAGMSRA